LCSRAQYKGRYRDSVAGLNIRVGIEMTAELNIRVGRDSIAELNIRVGIETV
jgi:hypothetical protein